MNTKAGVTAKRRRNLGRKLTANPSKFCFIIYSCSLQRNASC